MIVASPCAVAVFVTDPDTALSPALAQAGIQQNSGMRRDDLPGLPAERLA
ncbi:hypothetical protein [Streptomyces sp. NPDC048641]